MKDKQLAKKSLREEKRAVKDYTERRRESKGKEFKKAYSHAIPEEKEHAKLFRKALKK